MMKPNEYEAFISGYALALKISPKEFKSLHANNIFASAWVRALVADTSDWRQNALKQLQPLLFDNNRW